MKYFILTASFCLILFTGCAQGESQQKTPQKAGAADKKVGGPCEGCEAIYESPVSFDQLDWVDTLPGYFEEGPKLVVSGTIYKRDGKTPAPGIILYFYHTDTKGIYSTTGNEKGWGKRHGRMRGWVKTNENGEYRFYTVRPASYPNSNNPQHIHPTIKEPGFTEYYIDEFVFADDPLFNNEDSHRAEPRGGSGVLKPELKNGVYVATKNIVLGLNIPGYPEPKK